MLRGLGVFGFWRFSLSPTSGCRDSIGIEFFCLLFFGRGGEGGWVLKCYRLGTAPTH